MTESITIKDIDELISLLNFPEDSKKAILLKTIRSFYNKDEDLEEVKSIQAEAIIVKIWPFPRDMLLKKKKKYLQDRKEDISSLKSQINRQCRNFFWQGKNELRIGLGRFNTFHILGETKYENTPKLQTKIVYLEKLVADLDKGRLKSLEGERALEVVKNIKQDVSDREAQGIFFDDEQEYIFKKDVKYLEKQESSGEKVKKDSQMVIKVNEQIISLTQDLAALNKEAEAIDHDREKGKISESEGREKLAYLNKHRDSLAKVAKRLTEIPGDIQSEYPEMAAAVAKLEKIIEEFTIPELEPDITSPSPIRQKGLESAQDFEKGDSKEITDDMLFQDKEQIEQEFKVLQEQSRLILNRFKELHTKIKLLLAKKKTPDGLSDSEKEELQNYQAELSALQEEGEGILEKLRAIEKKSQGAVQEAAKFIISALEKFIKSKQAKKEVLMIVDEDEVVLKDVKYKGSELRDDSGTAVLQNSIEDIKSGNTKSALDKIENAIKNFEALENKLGSLKGERDKIPGTFQGKTGIGTADDMVEVAGSFLIDRYPVTIAQFKRFVEETEYQTQAEKKGFGWVYRKQGWFTSNTQGGKLVVTLQGSPSLSRIKAACWHNPEGEVKDINDLVSLVNFPVVQITYYDALSYAEWAGKRLPAEAEWRLAAGMERGDDKHQFSNGPDIPQCNNKKSNFKTASPVDSYPPNDYAIYDMMGNVWEWCESDMPDVKTVLGGCWNMNIEEIGYQSRDMLNPNHFNNTIGFRCVRDL